MRAQDSHMGKAGTEFSAYTREHTCVHEQRQEDGWACRVGAPLVTLSCGSAGRSVRRYHWGNGTKPHRISLLFLTTTCASKMF